MTPSFFELPQPILSRSVHTDLTKWEKGRKRHREMTGRDLHRFQYAFIRVYSVSNRRFDHMALRSVNSINPLAFLLGFSGLTLSVLDPVRDHRSQYSNTPKVGTC